MKRPILGTRGSPLARAQAEHALWALQKQRPDLRFNLRIIKTAGDKIATAAALRRSRGVFVGELEKALLRKRIDLAVHSLKDLPTATTPGVRIAAVLPREDPADVMITRTGAPPERLPGTPVIGTSSLRRQAFLRAAMPRARFVDLRGNLDTRLEKLQRPSRRLDAIVVAGAGVRRLYGPSPPFPVHAIPPDMLPPAPGQGAICLQTREGDKRCTSIAESVDHPESRLAASAERAILARLEGGCNVPIGALAEHQGGTLKLTCWIASLDGLRTITEHALGVPEEYEAIASSLEVMLRSHGAGELLEEIRPRSGRRR